MRPINIVKGSARWPLDVAQEKRSSAIFINLLSKNKERIVQYGVQKYPHFFFTTYSKIQSKLYMYFTSIMTMNI